MKIELKKLSFNERMSEETNCFVADLYIDGKKVGYCKNDGRGGCTDYRGNSSADNLNIALAEAYCKTLPKVKYGNSEYEQTLESVIDQLLEDHLNAKQEKKMQKSMETAILFGVPNGGSYSLIKFKVPLSVIPTNVLQSNVNDIIAKYCKDGVVILNNNLEALGITIP